MKTWLVRVSRPSKTPPKRRIYSDWEFHAPAYAQAMVVARAYAQDIADRHDQQVTIHRVEEVG